MHLRDFIAWMHEDHVNRITDKAIESAAHMPDMDLTGMDLPNDGNR